MQVTPAYLSASRPSTTCSAPSRAGSRYVYVCTSVACHLSNAKAVYDAIAAEAREQGLEDVEVREFECLGACDLAPMASIDGRYVGPLATDDAAELVRQMKVARPSPGRGLGDPGLRHSGPAAAYRGRARPPQGGGCGRRVARGRGAVPPPAEGPPPHRREITEPLAPGTSYAGEDIDPFTHDVLEPDEEEGEE